MSDKCPRCGSPDPKLHPAMQFEGEVQICPHEWHSAEATPTIEALQARVRELEDALKNINTGHCERCTSGIGSCFQYGYTVDARYTDDKVCDSCIADRALGASS